MLNNWFLVYSVLSIAIINTKNVRSANTSGKKVKCTDSICLFECQSREEIDLNLKCDGKVDCSDGSDEVDCDRGFSLAVNCFSMYGHREQTYVLRTQTADSNPILERIFSNTLQQRELLLKMGETDYSSNKNLTKTELVEKALSGYMQTLEATFRILPYEQQIKLKMKFMELIGAAELNAYLQELKNSYDKTATEDYNRISAQTATEDYNNILAQPEQAEVQNERK